MRSRLIRRGSCTSVSDAKRLKELETENGRLKKLLAESQLEIEVTREVLQKNGDLTGSTGGGAWVVYVKLCKSGFMAEADDAVR